LTWLKYFSPFYYYSGHDPLGNGLHVVDLAVLGAASVALVAFAALAFQRRDLRA
jgi:ABC-2 type transport system permease protein